MEMTLRRWSSKEMSAINFSEPRSFESHLEPGINGCHIRLVYQLKPGSYPQSRTL